MTAHTLGAPWTYFSGPSAISDSRLSEPRHQDTLSGHRQEVVVDFTNDLHVPGQEATEQAHWPTLKSPAGMVGVRNACSG